MRVIATGDATCTRVVAGLGRSDTCSCSTALMPSVVVSVHVVIVSNENHSDIASLWLQ